MNEKPTALVVEDSEVKRPFLVASLQAPEARIANLYDCDAFVVDAVECADHAREHLATRAYDILFLDLHLPAYIGGPRKTQIGKDLLRDAPKWPQTGIVVITNYADVENAVDVLTGGAVDFIDRTTAPDAKTIFGVAARNFSRLAQDREQIWLRTGNMREALREACLLRNMSDEFTRAAADVLNCVSESSDNLEVLLRSRLGIGAQENEGDEILDELTRINGAVQKGCEKIRNLRRKLPIESDRTPVTLSELHDDLVKEVEMLAATRHLRLEWTFDGNGGNYGIYFKDFRDASLEILHSAAQYAERETTIEVRLLGDPVRRTLMLAVAFVRSARPVQGVGTTDLKTYDLEADTVPLVRGLAKRMGGDVKAAQNEKGLYEVELEIPVEL